MDGGRSADRAAASRALRLMTWILPFLLWGLGFLSSRFLMGCDTPSALTRATAYALSGTVGWMVYLLIYRPRDRQTLWLTIVPYGSTASASMLGPTRTPWPFLPMLAHGIAVAIALAVVLGLMNRFMMRFMKSGRVSSPAPGLASQADQDPKMGSSPGRPTG